MLNLVLEAVAVERLLFLVIPEVLGVMEDLVVVVVVVLMVMPPALQIQGVMEDLVVVAVEVALKLTAWQEQEVMGASEEVAVEVVRY